MDMTTTETITWVPVTERLPETWRTVLLSTRRNTCAITGFIKENREWRITGEIPAHSLVTHWAELPVGPGQEAAAAPGPMLRTEADVVRLTLELLELRARLEKNGTCMTLYATFDNTPLKRLLATMRLMLDAQNLGQDKDVFKAWITTLEDKPLRREGEDKQC